MLNWTLENKKALVTGGTKGIGAAIVNAYIDLGAEVITIARTARELPDHWNGKVTLLTGDLADESFRKELHHQVRDRWGKLDILVNNVGTNIRKKFEDYTEEEYRKIFETNLFGMLDLTRSMFTLLQASGSASILNVASIAGSVDVGSGAPYGMSKSAIIQLTRNLAVEWAKHNIRVNTLSPWYIRTPLVDPVLNDPIRLEKILRRTPMQRIGEPHEIASIAAFLAMDSASYITGQDFRIDGGMMAQGL
ncbi:MAG: SDR family oxidoreductase [Bacteroidota bacterium]